jgi:c-di-GMP-binding flagellar brake protein YcgR
MVARAFSFWRRLFGKSEPVAAPEPHNGTTTAVAEERRLWVRYEANLQTHIELTQGPQIERSEALVRDVSMGGANLVTDRPYNPGQILSLELPTGDDGQGQVVLACVVRAIPEPDDRWSLGCVFSRELTVEDLEKFGAKKAKAAGNDQRTWVRYECALRATYQRVGDDQNQATYKAQVLNVSASGVGLLLTEPLEPGALITVTLYSKQGQPVRSILACVVHTTDRTNGEQAAGCNFIRELAEDELQSLL